MTIPSITASVLFLTVLMPDMPVTAQAHKLSVRANGRPLLEDGQPFF